MNIKVNDKMIETDEEGFLLNVDEWNDKVCEALIKQHETDGHKPLAKPHAG